MRMRRIGLAVRALLAIALAGLGLPCRACRREGAVMECLKPRGEEPDRIADETGMPLAVVLEVSGGLLG